MSHGITKILPPNCHVGATWTAPDGAEARAHKKANECADSLNSEERTTDYYVSEYGTCHKDVCTTTYIVNKKDGN